MNFKKNFCWVIFNLIFINFGQYCFDQHFEIINVVKCCYIFTIISEIYIWYFIMFKSYQMKLLMWNCCEQLEVQTENFWRWNHRWGRTDRRRQKRSETIAFLPTCFFWVGYSRSVGWVSSRRSLQAAQRKLRRGRR